MDIELIIGIIIGSLIGIWGAIFMIKKSKGLRFLFPKTPYEQNQIIINVQKDDISKRSSWSSLYYIIPGALLLVIFNILDNVYLPIAFGISMFVSWFISLGIAKIVYNLGLNKKASKA